MVNPPGHNMKKGMLDVSILIAECIQDEQDFGNLLVALRYLVTIVPTRILRKHHERVFNRICRDIPAQALLVMAPQLRIWLTTAISQDLFSVLKASSCSTSGTIVIIDAIAGYCLGNDVGYTRLQSRLRWKRKRLLYSDAAPTIQTALSIRDAAYIFGSMLSDMQHIPPFTQLSRITKGPHEPDATDDERILDALLLLSIN